MSNYHKCSSSDITRARPSHKTNKFDLKNTLSVRESPPNEKPSLEILDVLDTRNTWSFALLTLLVSRYSKNLASSTGPGGDAAAGTGGWKDAARRPKTGQRDGSWQAYRRRRQTRVRGMDRWRRRRRREHVLDARRRSAQMLERASG